MTKQIQVRSTEEALKLALEALKDLQLHTDDYYESSHEASKKGDKAITAIREALAEQPAQPQEPVAKKTRIGLVTSYGWDSLPVGTEFYTSPPAQRKYRRGDRLICLETEEYCFIHISGTDRQWIKFPDTHIGVYKNEQLAELFELLPKEIEFEQPAQRQARSADTWVHATTWRGLTDEDIDIAFDDTQEGGGFDDFARAIEAKLKEKNT